MRLNCLDTSVKGMRCLRQFLPLVRISSQTIKISSTGKKASDAGGTFIIKYGEVAINMRSLLMQRWRVLERRIAVDVATRRRCVDDLNRYIALEREKSMAS